MASLTVGRWGVSGVVEKGHLIFAICSENLQESALKAKGLLKVIFNTQRRQRFTGRKCRDYSQNESIGYEQTVRYYEKQSRRYFCEHTYEFVRWPKSERPAHILTTKIHPEIERLAKSIQNKMSEVTGAEMHAVKDRRWTIIFNEKSAYARNTCRMWFLSNPDEEKKNLQVTNISQKNCVGNRKCNRKLYKVM